MANNREEADGRWTRTTSPDGTYVWIVDAFELQMASWRFGGTLWQRRPHRKLFEVPYGWSFESREWTTDSELKIKGHPYSWPVPDITLLLDVGRREGRIDAHAFVARDRSSDPSWMIVREAPSAPDDSISLDAIVEWLEVFLER
jgi:hypothetical protein